MGANWASGFPPFLSHPQVPPGSALRTGQPPLASSISEPIRATPVATPPAEAPGERRPHAPPTQRPHSARAGPGERGLLPGCWVPASPPLARGPPSSYLATPSCRGWGFGGCSVSTMLMAAYSLIRNWSEGGSEDGDPCASPRPRTLLPGGGAAVSVHSKSRTVVALELPAGTVVSWGKTVAMTGSLVDTRSGAPTWIDSRGKQDTSGVLLGRPSVAELAGIMKAVVGR